MDKLSVAIVAIVILGCQSSIAETQKGSGNATALATGEEGNAPSNATSAGKSQEILVGIDGGKVGAVFQVRVTGGQVMKFCYCPPGKFTMGSPETEAKHSSDERQVPVTISKGFWMGQTTVTQAQWQAVMGYNPSLFQQDPNLPVQSVSWDEAQIFIAKLNGLVAFPNKWKAALPTGAQWEYACRAGTQTAFAYGDTLTDAQANFDDRL